MIIDILLAQTRKVRKWGDPILAPYSFTLAAYPGLASNFQAIPLYDETGQGGGITSFVVIDRQRIDHLINLQKADDFTVDQKMTWLAGSWRSRPYMGDTSDPLGYDWRTAQTLRWQAIVYGGQSVIVVRELDMQMDLPNHAPAMVRVAEILLYYMTDVRAVQNATAVHDDDVYNPLPRGVIHAPIWAGKYKYIPLEWLE